MLCIEEPERGVHPYLLGQLVAVLRKMTTGEIAKHKTQIILATHSAELLEFIEPQEVRLLSRDASDGPDLALVLVDQDDEPQRKRDLDAATADLSVTRVIAVAVKEFEAWLLADPDALRDAVGPVDSLPAAPEAPPRAGDAKGCLQGLGARCWSPVTTAHDEHDFRRTIAAACSLAVVANRCPSFGAFRGELRTG